jgi:Na+/H+ antiporter NhaD/arsenite permease-like protein
MTALWPCGGRPPIASAYAAPMPSLLAAAGTAIAPSIWTCVPFALLILMVAVLPLVPSLAHTWHKNSVKLIVAVALSIPVLVYYALRERGIELHGDVVVSAARLLGLPMVESDGHWSTGAGGATAVGAALNGMWEYVPFVLFLLALYVITGGVLVKGDVPAHPLTNTGILALGGLIASFVGTTGASMLLIRLLLQTNSERKHKVHTCVFFILIVCNAGGCLLPIGDPPLFLGYLKGVPFFWTLALWQEWALVLTGLLVMYYLLDRRQYARETPRDVRLDERVRQPVRVRGLINFLWLALAVAAVALVVPGKTIPGLGVVAPPLVREGLLILLIGLSVLTTPRGLRAEARFDLGPVLEVAALFLGIFITMQPAIELLSARGGELGLTSAWHYFWATGSLSAFLDNAPTYGVFLQVGIAATDSGTTLPIVTLLDGSTIRQDWLTGVSLGAVFFGALTYIGNGPNFMVKAICESQGVRMPSFFGFFGWACLAMLPLMALVTLLFFR